MLFDKVLDDLKMAGGGGGSEGSGVQVKPVRGSAVLAEILDDLEMAIPRGKREWGLVDPIRLIERRTPILQQSQDLEIACLSGNVRKRVPVLIGGENRQARVEQTFRIAGAVLPDGFPQLGEAHDGISAS